MSVNLLQQLNTIPNPGGIGVPVTQYTTDLQKVLTAQLTGVSTSELATLSGTQTALTSLQSALSAFQNASNTLASTLTWNPVNVTNSNSAVIAVSATAGALNSNYTIAVTQLAQAQVNVATAGHQSSATASSTLASGSLSITPSGQSGVTISITSGESLSAIAAAVNNATTAVQASVINTGSSSTPYELMFQSTQTGLSNSFTLSDSATSTGASQLSASTATVTAQNAAATIDGSINVQSQTNTFSNAIPDVTFTALQSGGTSSVQISQNTSSVIQSVQSWMSAYNSLIDLIHSGTAYTPASGNTAASVGPLFSDGVTNQLLFELPNSLNQSVGSGTISALAQIGIVTDPTTGHLEFQPSAGFQAGGAPLQNGQTLFTQALTSNQNAVESFFGVVSGITSSSAYPVSGLLGNVSTMLSRYGTIAGSGEIGTELTSISAQQTSISNYLTTVNQQITAQVQNFAAQLNALNTALAHSQSQMSLLSSLMGGGGSSASSSSSAPAIP
ncbi:flagellar filament capping protein FliD [Ferroacidibacillus organovorans]|uniref:Flagellar hook-associated protein 2 n=1 Tax=Ferroacidibacillus organovorans TaxID=1765683 RepID=A0A162UFN1_9BACL|nr:flagellar filament capping protein FliD [Ferroacidibacillus organovorans]KYP81716.1 hypothetical protein AYJ22_06245 [Ferroacidibacillus organovorans]OAG94256.1 hypothetical protein AYW79_06470 [Ferroacidibacillus organovorans]OPG16909.1 hypothetical protein B2M26_04095 [Ferroacidibacillus organovorans]